MIGLGAVGRNLLQTLLACTLAAQEVLIPLDRHRQGLREPQHRPPSQLLRRLRAIQLEHLRLVRVCSIVNLPRNGGTPRIRDLFHYPAHRLNIVWVRPEVPAAGEGCPILVKFLRQHQISPKRLENVLPRPGRLRAADLQHLSLGKGPDYIRDQPILRPVSSTDCVSSAGRSECHSPCTAAAGPEEGAAVSTHYELSTCFAIAVRIVSS